MLSLPGGAAQLRLWSAEQPHLYLLLLTLVQRGSSGGDSSCEAGALEIEACQVGAQCVQGAVVRRAPACMHHVLAPLPHLF
jgi:hypothetical protein